MENWNKTNDFYNREVVTQDVWSRKCKYGTIYVIDKIPFTYTFSCGADSDYSFTGCFYGCSKITNIHQAMEVIDLIAARRFNNQIYNDILKEYE